MVKNERLPANIITPTTKAADHDVPITPEEVCIYCYTYMLYAFLLSNINAFNGVLMNVVTLKKLIMVFEFEKCFKSARNKPS